MEKSLKCMIFVGKFDKEEYLYVEEGHIINKHYDKNLPKYSLTYIDESTIIVECNEPIIKVFREKISNSEKEAILAFMAFIRKNKSV